MPFKPFDVDGTNQMQDLFKLVGAMRQKKESEVAARAATSMSRYRRYLKNAAQILDDGRSLADWVEQLMSYDPDIVWKATHVVAKAGESVIPVLLKMLEDEDWIVRRGAVWAIYMLKSCAKATAQNLINMLNHEHNTTVLWGIIFTLPAIGTPAHVAVPALIPFLRPCDAVLKEAARILRFYGMGAASAVPTLVETLDNSKYENHERFYMIEALGEIGPGAHKATTVLCRIIDTETVEFVQEAADAALEKILNGHTDPNVEITCPNCQRKLRIPRKFVGTSGRCNSCKGPFTPLLDEDYFKASKRR